MNKMKKYISLFLCAAIALTACQNLTPEKIVPNEEYAGSRASVELSSADPIPAEGGTITAKVHRSPAFEVSLPKTADWVTVSQSDSTLSITAKANPSAVSRHAHVSIIDKELKISVTSFDVVQEGSEKDVEPVKYKDFSAGPEAVNVAAKETSAVISVTADEAVEWTITSSNAAFVPDPASGKGSATVTVSFPANTEKAEVSATLTVSTASTEVRNNSYTITITQEAAKDEKEAVKPAPGTVLAEWYFATSQVDILAAHFNEATADDLADAPGNGGVWVEPNVSGKGRLEYYNGIDKAAAGILDAAHKRCKRSIGSYGEPVVYGTYKDDYILWTAYTENDAPLAAGTKLSLYFVLRPNNFFVMKYWLVEYLDGDEWKVAGTAKEGDGFKYNVELTYADGSGNQTNTVINPVVTLSKDTEAAIFRITATSNAGCMDGAPVTLINKSHALRFAGEDCNANTPQYSVKEHPMIKVVE